MREISISTNALGLVVCCCIIPATRELEIGMISRRSQTGKKVTETPSQPISQTWCYVPVIPASVEDIGRKMMV